MPKITMTSLEAVLPQIPAAKPKKPAPKKAPAPKTPVDLLGTCRACLKLKRECPGLTEQEVRNNCRSHEKDEIVCADPRFPLGKEWAEVYKDGLKADGALIIGASYDNLSQIETEKQARKAVIVTAADGTSQTIIEAAKILVPVENAVGVQVEITESGRYKIFGYPYSRIVIWAGSKGWTLEETQGMLKAVGMPEMPEASVRTLLKNGRAEPAELTADQERLLGVAAGKIKPEAPKPAPKPKAAPKPKTAK